MSVTFWRMSDLLFARYPAQNFATPTKSFATFPERVGQVSDIHDCLEIN